MVIKSNHDNLVSIINNNNKELFLEEINSIINNVNLEINEIKWNDVFIACLNNSDIFYLDTINNLDELPTLYNYSFSKNTKISCTNVEKNNIIYKSCFRFNSLYYENFSYHINQCVECKNIRLSSRIKIKNTNIIDSLLNFLPLTKKELVYNCDINKDTIKYFSDLPPPDYYYIVKKLFNTSSFELNLEVDIGEQIELFINLYDISKPYAESLLEVIIEKKHTELVKLLLPNIEINFLNIGLCIFNNNSIELISLFVEKLYNKIIKDEANNDNLKIINTLAINIPNIYIFKIFNEKLNSYIKSKVFHKLMKNESNKSEKNQSLDFILELSKYDNSVDELYDSDTSSSSFQSTDETSQIKELFGFNEEVESNTIVFNGVDEDTKNKNNISDTIICKLSRNKNTITKIEHNNSNLKFNIKNKLDEYTKDLNLSIIN